MDKNVLVSELVDNVTQRALDKVAHETKKGTKKACAEPFLRPAWLSWTKPQIPVVRTIFQMFGKVNRMFEIIAFVAAFFTPTSNRWGP